MWRRCLAIVLLAGCSAGEEGTPVAYALSKRPVLPFPTDAIMTADASKPTGQRIALAEQGKNLGDADEAIYLFGPDFARAIDGLDGWSTLGPVFAPLAEPADPATLPGHVLLIDLAAPSIVATDVWTFGGKTMFGQESFWVGARAPVPLAPKTRHAIVLLRGLLNSAGQPMASAPAVRALLFGEDAVDGDAERVAAARRRFVGLTDALASLGIDREDVLSADVFTTQSIDEQTDVLLAAYRSAPVPQISEPALFEDPADDPRWEGPDDADRSAIRGVARVTFDVPNYRAEVKGRHVLDEGAATLQSQERIEALLVVPNGAGPFPIAVYQHGVGDDKESVWHFANELAAAGVAIVAFDAPLHGFRTDRPGNAATEFINIVDPALVVDNFRQAECEAAFFVRAIDEMAKVDLFGGRPLDPSRLLWIGNSLGSIIGSAVVGLEPRYEGAALMVGGGTLLEFFDRVLGGFALDQFPAELFVAVAQAALDRGDPSNYARRSSEKQILLMQAMQDETMPPGATAALGRAMQLPQVAPVFERSAGLPEVTGPVPRRGWTQFSPAKHSLAYSPGNHREAYERSREQLFHFVSTWASTGSAEIK